MEIYSVENVMANDENAHYPFLFLSVPKKVKAVKKGNIDKRQIFKNGKINLGTRNSDTHGNLFCGKCDGKRRKRPLPVFVFVRAQKGKSCEKGNIYKG